MLIATTFGAVQASTPNIIGIDGYYHIKVAALMWQQGWRLVFPLDFPWLQLTILGPGHYSDHHYLFHVLQAPFTQGDLRVGAKMAAVLFATGGLYTTYLFLARRGVRYPLLWIALLIACAPTFLWRQSMARPQSLFLALLVGAIWAVLIGRPRLLLPLGFLAVWLFDGFPFLLGIPAAAVAAHLVHRVLALADEDADRRGLRLALAALGWALLGVALGLLLHPYVPRNLDFAYLHLLPKAVPSAQLDVPVGQEWNPFSLRGFVTRAGPVAALTALGMVPPLLALARRRGPSCPTIMLGGIAVAFMVMAARSQRLIEYFPALALLFWAWSWGHPSSTGAADLAWFARRVRAWISARPLRRPSLASAEVRGEGWWSRVLVRPARDDGALSRPAGPWGRRLAAAWPWLAATALGPAIVTSIAVTRRDANNGLAWDTYRDAALWLVANSPADSRVFTADWDDFPHMFFWNTHNTYLTGLDPTYMSLHDARLYRRWRDVGAGRVEEPSRVIWPELGARYVVSDRQRKHEAFLKAAEADSGLEVVLRTPAVVVFRVRDARD